MVDSHVVEEEERNTTLTLSNDIPSFKLFGKRIVTTVDQTLPTTSDTTPENHPLESSERQSTTEPAPVEAVTVAVGLVCPRCKSRETKFCYFNNYNVNQPRHFCRGCHRYWTAGGAIRNVPIGAGRRKASNSGSSSSCSSSSGAKGGGSFGYSHDHDEIGIEESVVVKQWLQPESDESVVGFLPVKRGNDIDGFHGRIRRPKV